MSLENVARLMQQGFENIATNELDVLSLDLDGNDFYFAQELLRAGVLPKLFILEYNAKFPPPIKWTIKYDANHSWDNTDYFGASLALFSELLTEFSYTLVCCNAATGANAFFVRNEYLSHFADVPKNIEDIFVGCRYQLYKRWGHPPSPKTIERMLQTDLCITQIVSFDRRSIQIYYKWNIGFGPLTHRRNITFTLDGRFSMCISMKKI